MSAAGLLILYSVLIVLASLAGGALPTIVRMTHTRMQMMMSFVGGVMLGVGLVHLLPHAIAELGSVDWAVGWLIIGLLAMFFLIRMFHFHEHGPLDRQPTTADEQLSETISAGHDGHTTGHTHNHGSSHRLSWFGVAIGMFIHTFIDGIALGATIEHLTDSPTGLGVFVAPVFLAILLHKPLDAMSVTMVMAAGGWSMRSMQMVNAGFALICPLGAAMFFIGARQFTHYETWLVGSALGFSAGVFLCIALSDLLPELQFHTHDRFKLSVALLGGVVLAYAIGWFEPPGLHDHQADDHHDSPAAADGHPHPHDSKLGEQ